MKMHLANLSKLIKHAHKYKLRTLRELDIFIFIISFGQEPITVQMIERKSGYPYTAVKKVIYKLGSGRESGYDGYELISYRESNDVEGRAKVIQLTAKGRRLSKLVTGWSPGHKSKGVR